MKKAINKILIICCLANSILPCSTTSQVPGTLWFQHLDEQGLPSNRIEEVFQDSEGFIWIRSFSGLNRYDGLTVKSFPVNAEDSLSLRDNIITGGFFEDKRKDIWFCTNSWIQRYDRRSDTFRSYPLIDKNGLRISDNYHAFALERDSFLWLMAGNQEIFRFDIHRHKQSYESIAKVEMEIYIFPGFSAEGRLKYIFTANASKGPGLEIIELDKESRLVHRSKKFATPGSAEPLLNIFTVLYEQDTLIWLATRSGLYKWNQLSDKLMPQLGTDLNTVHKIAAAGMRNLLVIQYRKGARLFDKSTGQSTILDVRLLNEMPMIDINHNLQNPYVDPLGNFWIVLNSEGVVYSQPSKTKFQSIPKFTLNNGSTNYEFRAMVQNPDNREIWCSTFNNGLFRLSADGVVQQHFHPENTKAILPVGKEVYHLLLARDNVLWIAGREGVAWFDSATFTFREVFDLLGQSVPNVAYLYQLDNGPILASSLQHGVFELVNNNGKMALRQILAAKDNTEYFTTIFEDTLKSIYIGHKYSDIQVYKYANQKLSYQASLDIKGSINGFLEAGRDSVIWIATSNGLQSINKFKLDAPPKTYYSANEQNLQIQSMAVDRRGRLWLGTNSGLTSYDPQLDSFTVFSLANGSQSSQFYALSVLTKADGSIWFGGNNGITVVNPDSVKLLDSEPRIQITEIKINDQTAKTLQDSKTGATNVTMIEHLVRPYQENTISFSFIAIDYSDPHSTQLRYKLEGFDKNWVYLKKGEAGFARYSNLPPREYVFKISAANSDGVWADNLHHLYLKIAPPWYRTWWATVLFAIIALLILWIGYTIRIRQIRKEAEYKQRVAETETAVLRLQMKPHFIFNSMHSISSYMLQKDVDTANDYLLRFAKLMRMILKLAEKPFLILSKEIELLELYLQLESMRFQDKIEYEIKLVDDLDPEEYFVPTMLLQPFVENAVLHGLTKKAGPKKVEIAFEVKEDRLYCTVQDNGVGRNMAAATHESKAIAITQRRLELMDNKNRFASHLQIIDLKDETGQPAGTKVVIDLSLS